ncbi:YjbF family lipoprotein [Pseudophaeobacter arcticus]|uniref:YjbF family lipoprotein n=1 Tax=Pseudophaeobacter arcticus TaxID=385492 RepID=UPI003A96BC38
MKHLILALCGAALLLGCTNDNDSLRQLRQVVQPGKVVVSDPRVERLIETKAPRKQVSFERNDLAGVVALESRRDGIETWLSVDGATLIMQEGMVIGTRGFGGGLMASDVAQSLDAVLSGQGGYTLRFHSFLNGNDETVLRSYKCEVKSLGSNPATILGELVPARQMTETCRSLGQVFVNSYWVAEAGGGIIQSRQWLGDFLGSVTLRDIPQDAF